MITFQISHLQACCILWEFLGFKKAFKACFNYPALVLTPCFGVWTFGPAARNNESTSNSCMSCESKEISVSYKHTWVTFGISLIGVIVTFFAEYGVSEFNTALENNFNGAGPFWMALSVIYSGVLFIVILPILIGFVQGVDKCCNCLCTITVTDFSKAKICLCTCCPTECFPVVQRVELDVDNMD